MLRLLALWYAHTIEALDHYGTEEHFYIWHLVKYESVDLIISGCLAIGSEAGPW